MKIQSYGCVFNINGKRLEHHLCSEFKHEHSTFWGFGVGLGDQAVIVQAGNAFLDMPDPQLGDIVVSFGSTKTALFPKMGDYNVWWAWGDRTDWINYYLDNVTVEPELCLCPSFEILKQIEESGLNGVYCPVAAGKEFHPLNLKRKGLGYAGLDSKPFEQMNLILNPIKNRKDFTWQGQKSWVTLEELNVFYNQKQILFGMLNTFHPRLGCLPNRVFETLATDTPLIFPKHSGFKELFNKEYPWQTESREETVKLVNNILDDYEANSETAKLWGKLIRTEHTYKKRLETLFSTLKELKK